MKQLTKPIKRLFVLFCAAILTLPVAGCAAKGGTGPGLVVYAESVMNKVIQDKAPPAQMKQELAFSMAKNEVEGGQIIMHAKRDISSYTVSVSDLASDIAVIKKSDIDIFNEKYIALMDKKNNNPDFLIDAMVPDALLPMDVAVEYGENKIEKSKNQAVYIEVTTTEATVAGTYRGNAQIVADGETYNMPISVQVFDFAIPSSPSTKNYWILNNRAHYGSAEMDSSDEMATQYFERMLEYRIQSSLPFMGVGGIPKYIELLRKYYDWPGFSGYNLYYERLGTFYNGVPSEFNAHLMQDYIKAIVRASMEDGVNYMSKAFVNFGDLIDEPGTLDQYLRVKDVIYAYELCIEDVAKQLRAELVTYPNYRFYLQEIEPDITGLQCILPEGFYGVKQQLDALGVNKVTHCPMANILNNEAMRQEYANDPNGHWFYTCVVPYYPFPSNHIDDYLLGLRLISWMQKAYNIDGYLNWAVALHTGGDGRNIDAYANSSRGFCPGDGFMVYPGAPYGIYGPVGSLRAVTYRDGMEDFEYLKILEDLYREYGFDASEVLSAQYRLLFSGTTPTTSVDLFDSVKQAIADMILSGTDELGIIYNNIDVSFDGIATVKFAAVSADAQVYQNDRLLSADASGIYMATVDLAESSYLNLKLRLGNREKSFRIYLSGRHETVCDFEESVPEGIIIPATAQSALSEEFHSDGEKSLKVTLKRISDTTKTSYFSFMTSMFNGGNLKDVASVRFKIYNPSPSAVTLKMKTFTGIKYYDIADYTIESGWNEIVIKDVSAFEERDKVSRIFFTTLELDDETNRNGVVFYLDSLSLLTV